MASQRTNSFICFMTWDLPVPGPPCTSHRRGSPNSTLPFAACRSSCITRLATFSTARNCSLFSTGLPSSLTSTFFWAHHLWTSFAVADTSSVRLGSPFCMSAASPYLWSSFWDALAESNTFCKASGSTNSGTAAPSFSKEVCQMLCKNNDRAHSRSKFSSFR